MRGRLARAGRLWRTVKVMTRPQIMTRVRRKLRKPPMPAAGAVPVRAMPEGWVRPCVPAQSWDGAETFTFLNETGGGDWRAPDKALLWLYNLHYFDDLNAEGAGERVEAHRALLARWVAENPPVEGPGWEPYPLSRRIVNIIKWALREGPLDVAVAESLAVQVRALADRLETHLGANHLYANGKALCFAGLFFEGAEADRWLKTGTAIIEAETREQILPDGGHYELSTMYHGSMLEDALDLVNLFAAYGREAPAGLRAAIPGQLSWLAVMKHSDGRIALFSDGAHGIAPEPAAITDYAGRLGMSSLDETSPSDLIRGSRAVGSELDRRVKPDDDNARGASFESSEEAGLIDLPDSGYSRLSGSGITAFFDAGAVGARSIPGHGHADTLSIEVSVGETRIFVNGGTSVYGEGELRMRERGTAHHNTVTLDGLNSSELWAGFRCGRQARIIDRQTGIEGGVAFASAGHDGYARSPGWIHHRRVALEQGGLVIEDRLDPARPSPGTPMARIAFRVNPALGIERVGAATFQLTDGLRTVATFTGDTALEWSLEDTHYSPGFGLRLPAFALCGTLEISGSRRFSCMLHSNNGVDSAESI